MTRLQRPTIPVFDASYISENGAGPGGALWPDAYRGTTRTLMLGAILTTDTSQAATSQRVLEIADACHSGKPFQNFAFYPHNGIDNLSYGPRCFGLVNLDLEIPKQDFSPDAMAKLVNPIADKYPVAICSPDQIVVKNDQPLKSAAWVWKNSPEYVAAQAWATDNTWVKRLAYIECGSYFGKPADDAAVMLLIRNRIRLAQAVYPYTRTIVTQWGSRSPDFGGSGQLESILCAAFVKMLHDEHADGCQLWGERVGCVNLRNALCV